MISTADTELFAPIVHAFQAANPAVAVDYVTVSSTELMRAKNQGSTVFFSSHILSDIDQLCDRIAVLHEGNIVFVGTPDALKQRHDAHDLERAFLAAITA